MGRFMEYASNGTIPFLVVLYLILCAFFIKLGSAPIPLNGSTRTTRIKQQVLGRMELVPEINLQAKCIN